jgi:hypothetical protein
MRSIFIACAFFAGAVSTAPALANMCRTDSNRTCPTGMPADGYCMCGNEGGTVVTSDHPKFKAQRPASAPHSAAPPPQ